MAEVATMRRAMPAFMLLVIKLSPENTIVGLGDGSPAANGFPPDFRLHQPICKRRDILTLATEFTHSTERTLDPKKKVMLY
jgi:hypothetical protein